METITNDDRKVSHNISQASVSVHIDNEDPGANDIIFKEEMDWEHIKAKLDDTHFSYDRKMVGNSVMASEDDDKAIEDTISVFTSIQKFNCKTEICLFCQTESERLHANLICDPCYQANIKARKEQFMNKIRKCKICTLSLCNGMNRIKHDCTHPGVYVCDHCSSGFREKSHLEEHMVRRFEKYTCSKCLLIFCSEKEMKLHIDICHNKLIGKPNDNFVSNNKNCNKCRELFKTQVNVNDHVCKHKHKCNICDKAFAKLSDMKRHLLTHEINRQYTCQYCGKSFKQSRYLKCHIIIHENITQYKCKYCEKSFCRSDVLKKHLAIHENKRQYKCQSCEKSFNRSDVLKQHVLSHENNRRYKCQYCEKCFTQSGNLQQHILIHENNRQHKCQYCEMSFNQSRYLKQHILIHENNRQYKCQYCGKSFTQSSHLKQHIPLHENNRQYKCQYCEKSFNRSGCLKTHTLIHKN